MSNGWKSGVRCLISVSILLGLTTACSLFNRPPVAVIAVTPNAGFAPLEVLLDAKGSYDPDGSAVKYEWTVGDGASSFDEQLRHVYASQANYRVVLRVTDDDGATGTAEATVSVSRLDLTGTWAGVIRDDVDVPLRGPYALNLVLCQMGDDSLVGSVGWTALIGFNITLPIKTGHVVGTNLDIVASGLFSADPAHFDYVFHSVHLTGRFDGGALQGMGSWDDDGTTFQWAAWSK